MKQKLSEVVEWVYVITLVAVLWQLFAAPFVGGGNLNMAMFNGGVIALFWIMSRFETDATSYMFLASAGAMLTRMDMHQPITEWHLILVLAMGLMIAWLLPKHLNRAKPLAIVMVISAVLGLYAAAHMSGWFDAALQLNFLSTLWPCYYHPRKYDLMVEDD